MGIRVAVAGAAGRMGREVVRAVLGVEDMELSAAVDHVQLTADAGVVAGALATGILIENELGSALVRTKTDVLVDFTIPACAMENIHAAVSVGVATVVGTTGLTAADLSQIGQWSRDFDTPVFVAPNFAIGAVLMMLFAQQAAKYLPDVEIIELHHDRKVDSPSGTALRTAELIRDGRTRDGVEAPAGLVEKVEGARGAEFGGVHIHSVRLPGHVAHQQVIFGGLGETLTVRHDSFDRVSFMSGVLLAVRKVRGESGVVVGLENLL